MSIKVFQDNVFPQHVSDLMNLMHMIVFSGTDGEEKWETFLNLKQKEYIALGLSQYYQCGHCSEHHLRALCKTGKTTKKTLIKNISAMILFLRIDTRSISKSEKDHWINAWKRFAKRIAAESNDKALPHLIGLAIGIARDDEFLIQFCGNEVNTIFTSQGINVRAVIGELEAVVIFMKAAASKNRIVDKVEALFSDA